MRPCSPSILSSASGQPAEGATTPGRGFAHLGAGRFAEIEFPLPPLLEQTRIADEADRLMTTAGVAMVTVASDIARLVRLRQSILKWAFEGRLVDQDPTDEPAAVLLERIRAERETRRGGEIGRSDNGPGTRSTHRAQAGRRGPDEGAPRGRKEPHA